MDGFLKIFVDMENYWFGDKLYRIVWLWVLFVKKFNKLLFCLFVIMEMLVLMMLMEYYVEIFLFLILVGISCELWMLYNWKMKMLVGFFF